MEQDSQHDALHAAMTTAEHRSLGNVLAVIRRLEELRSRGLTSAQIAERIRLTHPSRPGGGPWSAEAVERVLEIADANRRQAAPPSSGRPVARSVPTTPATARRQAPAPSADRGEYRPPAGHRAAGGARGDDQRVPLRVEPRRYHQRPAAQPESTIDPDSGRRWPAFVGLLTLIGLVAMGVGLYQIGVFDQFTTTDGMAAPAAPETTDSSTAGDQPTGDATSGDEGVAPADEVDAASAGVDGDPADSLVIRIEPSTPEKDNDIAPASATIRSDGKLYIEGAFRSESEAQRFLESAAGVFGEAALVPEYTIDPAAPDPTVSDVALEKPVLFESGSAVIDPEFIPFLEACGDVLKLNPHIVMSVTAFTDASGDAEFNLALSQRRADAVIAFYRNLDIGDDQLISAGFGESDFVADNDTEEGRQQNRRAMLELLNVMKEA